MSVSGQTGKQDQRSPGSSLLTAANTARSTLVCRGRFPLRLRIASWWRSTRISGSRPPPRRTSRPRSPQNNRYSPDITADAQSEPTRPRSPAAPSWAESNFFTAGGCWRAETAAPSDERGELGLSVPNTQFTV
jgi:hypothetical protein